MLSLVHLQFLMLALSSKIVLKAPTTSENILPFGSMVESSLDRMSATDKVYHYDDGELQRIHPQCIHL